MRTPWAVLIAAICLPAVSQTRVDPKMLSIHPFAGERGSTFVATVRGNGLTGATASLTDDAPFEAVIEDVKTESPAATSGRNKTAVNLVTIRVKVKETAKPGRYPLRLITRNGVSNALPLHVLDLPMTVEPAGSHNTKDSATVVPAFPTIFSGLLSHRGEADIYRFRVKDGETLTFEVISGLPQIASGGSAATVANFDPSLSIFEVEGSWFDSDRLKRIAFNDEPVWVFGRSTDAHLIHRFKKAGEYLLRVEAFAGQGGPDYSYLLKITSGEQPQDLPSTSGGWQERVYTRRLDADRLNQLSARGGKAKDQKSVETYRAAPEATTFKLPGTIEGALTHPGEAHPARFHLDAPADIAIEVETPSAAPPFFNPIVRLLNATGEEVATNVFAGRGACTGALTKSLQAKTIVPIRDTGDYTLEIRDATADLASPEFRYRIQVRPQIPHIGQIKIDTDVVNLAPGEAKTIRVMFDREEGYRGAITVAAESLPPGIFASVGADYEPDTDPPSTVGKRERYVPRTERAVVILSASADALPFDRPHEIRLTARPLVDGKIGENLTTKPLHVMVIAKP